MEKIFYAERNLFPSSETAVKALLYKFFNRENPIIGRTKNGKPYLKNDTLFFSVSHTKTKLFVAFSDKNVGIDAENVLRAPVSPSVLKKFTEKEQAEILSRKDFLQCWTAKESAVKYLGGTLASDLKRLEYLDGMMYYDGAKLGKITPFSIDNHTLSVCHENDFSSAAIIPLVL